MSSKTDASRIFLGWQMINSSDPIVSVQSEKDWRDIDEMGFDLSEPEVDIFEVPQFVQDIESEDEESLLID
jgi:hypothetical protein